MLRFLLLILYMTTVCSQRPDLTPTIPIDPPVVVQPIDPIIIRPIDPCLRGYIRCDSYHNTCVPRVQCSCYYGVRCPGTTNCVNAYTECTCPDAVPYACESGCSATPCDTTPDLCAVIRCAAGYTCENGKCIPPLTCATILCRAGYVCENNKCVQKDRPTATCEYLTCLDGYTCNDGRCVQNEYPTLTCETILCVEGYVCENAKCVQKEPPPITCANILCENGYYCENAQCIQSPVYTPPTMPTHFANIIRDWVNANQETYAAWNNQAKGLYVNGYYIDPTKRETGYVPPSSYLPPPVYTDDTCYSAQYDASGYSNYGYDKNGYDPYGYDEAGYDRNGWSRYGVETDSSFNALGTFKNPEYSGLTAKFYNNGTVRTDVDGIVLRYDSYGYDQYDMNIYGRPRPARCHDDEPVPDPEPQPPTGGQDDDDGLVPICEGSSEIASGDKWLYLRKSTTAMTPSDWSRFRTVWHQLNQNGKIGEYTILHRQVFQQHNSLKFLPWHREFVARFENEMHLIDPCVTLPYWDTVASPQFPAGIASGVEPNFPPDARFLVNGQLSSTDPVTRSIGTAGNLPNAGLLTVLMQDTTFDAFSGKLEQYHNAIHMYVNGDMGTINEATQDPVFFMVHGYIDRIWDQWQGSNPNQPVATHLGAINPLTWGGNDNRVYEDVDNVEEVSTSRGVGYRYI